MSLTDRLRETALAEGFSDFGVCKPDSVPETAARLAAFVEAGYHGPNGLARFALGAVA